MAAIREAVGQGADVILLPELVTSGYVFASREEAASVAITADDPLLAEWAAEAALVHGGRGLVIAGFCERGDDGKLYNSAAVVDPAGVQAVYRKLHLWDREKLFFEPGHQPPPVLDTAVGRIGVMSLGNVNCTWVPCFVRPDERDFSLLGPQPGLVVMEAWSVTDDYFGQSRGPLPNVGAIEQGGEPIALGIKRARP